MLYVRIFADLQFAELIDGPPTFDRHVDRIKLDGKIHLFARNKFELETDRITFK